MSRSGLGRMAAPALVALAFLALFPGVFLRGETFGFRDMIFEHRPSRRLFVELTRASGGVPLWNPYFSSGQPFAANPHHEAFHPLTQLFLVLPFEHAFRLQVLVPVAATLAGMWLLLRALGSSAAAAWVGALSWGLGGYLLSLTNMMPILHAVAPLPWLAAFLVRLLTGGDRRDFAAAALAFALVLLGAEPATLLSVPLLLPALVLAAGTSRGARPSTRAVLAAAAALLCGAAIAGRMLVPAADLLASTDRGAGLAAEEADLWSLPPARLAELVLPRPLGEIESGIVRWHGSQERYRRLGQPLVLSLYPGVLATGLAALALLRRPRAAWPWLATAAVSFLLACGENLPLWGAARALLPPLAAVRYPEKLTPALMLPLAVLAAAGFDVLLASLARRPQAARAAVALVPLALVADLVVHGRDLVPTVAPATLDTPPPFLRELLEPPLTGRLFHAAALRTSAWSPLALAPPPIPAQWRIATTIDHDYDRTALAWTKRADAQLWAAHDRDPRLLPLLLAQRGVEAMVSFPPPAPGARAPRQDRVEVHRLGRPRPKLELVSRVETIANDERWAERAVELGPELLGSAILAVDQADGVPSRPGPGTVRVLRENPVELDAEIDVEGPSPGLLVRSQTWDSGWSATLDGLPVHLRRADVAFGAVLVPPGRHRLELRYTSAPLRAGTALTLLGLAITAAVGLWRLPVARHETHLTREGGP